MKEVERRNNQLGDLRGLTRRFIKTLFCNQYEINL